MAQVVKQKEVKYLNKDFNSFKAALIEHAKTYFPDSYNDFNESSPGMMFIEMAAYVGDVLSYYIDSQFKESLLAYAEEKNPQRKKEHCLSFADKTNSEICAIVKKQLKITKSRLLKKSNENSLKDLTSSLQPSINKKSKIKYLD